MKQPSKIYYRKNLPHIQPVGATFFVTGSLKGSLPKDKLKQLREEYSVARKQTEGKKYNRKANLFKNYFQKFDSILHENKEGPNFLSNSKIADILLARIRQYDGQLYNLIAYTIMSNHFHMLIDTSIQLHGNLQPTEIPKNYQNLDKIMNLIKGGSSRFINQFRGKTGTQVWQNESFDTYMRNERMTNYIIAYILNNPIMAGIVKKYEDHPYTWVALQ